MTWNTVGMIGVRRCFALAVVCGMTMEAPYQVCAQSFPAPASATQSLGEPHTKLIPSLRLAERYDSNVFFVQGANLEDYVTTMSPQLMLTHKNQWVEALVGGGATGEVYVKNSGLNYVGGNGTVDLNLDRAVNSFIQGLQLRIVDDVVYTPQPLAFASLGGGNQLSQAFVQGLQSGRVNTWSNTARVESSYFFSPFTGVNVTYTDQRIRFGQTFAAPSGATQGTRFNTNFQNLTSGLVIKPSPSDTLLFAHQYQKATFPNSSSNGEDSGFSTQGAIARWTRAITPAIRTTVEGGFAVISPSSAVRPVAAASLQWKGQYTTVEISYSRDIAPSFLFASTALLSQVVNGHVRRQITEPLSVSLTGSYAVNQSVPDSSLVRFESYSVSPSLEYKIGRNIRATLSYTRSEFQQVFSGESFDFDRNMVMVSVLAEWR